ncbi:MAG: Mo-dependent nitrogenase C-terminal domain-containing protein [Cyanobacteria bacterium J06634_6]
MTLATQNSAYTQEQVQIWLRGLLTVAWADGTFDNEEKAIIHAMVESEFAPAIEFESLDPVEPSQLLLLELSPAAAQNFLRMAVMVALADGTYSEAESDQILAFAEVLSPDEESLATLRSTLSKLVAAQTIDAETNAETMAERAPARAATSEDASSTGASSSLHPPENKENHGVDPLKPAREWLDQLSVEDPRLAKFVCKLVPSQCPFERDVKVFGHKIVHIPPMCKINPLYEQLVGLRFRALSYLADDVGEDVSAYL